jgi:hypothetical protein
MRAVVSRRELVRMRQRRAAAAVVRADRQRPELVERERSFGVVPDGFV